MNGTSLQSLQPWLRPYAQWLCSVAPYAGVSRLTITSVKRSRAQQQALYESYLAGRNSYPVLPPGQSKHEYGLAWDMVTEPYSALSILGSWWKQVGGAWSKTDPIHFEA